jgi:hypothetical protein
VSICSTYRQYLGALADGEVDVVPPAAVDHVADCAGCQREVDAHREANRKLRLAIAAAPVKASRTMRWLRPAAVAVVLLLAVAGTAVWRYSTGEDRVAAAAAVAGQPPQFRADDSHAIRNWCARAANRPMPEVALDSLSPVGARMDRRSGTDIVTVSYRSAGGDEVEVAWLDSTTVPAEHSSIQARSINGHTVLVIASPVGTAVVMGSASRSVLWETAVAIERANTGTPGDV